MYYSYYIIWKMCSFTNFCLDDFAAHTVAIINSLQSHQVKWFHITIKCLLGDWKDALQDKGKKIVNSLRRQVISLSKVHCFYYN